METQRNTNGATDWIGAPMTRPICPMHGIREVPRQLERDGEVLVEFACPVDECDHSWIVKRVRV